MSIERQESEIDKTNILWLELSLYPSKGQLISECLFDVLNFPKKQRKNLTNFCPGLESKKWSNQQNKGTFL